MEITNSKSNGVEIIRDTLMDASKKSNIEITYLGAPKYRISVTSKDFKSAEKLKPLIDEIQHSIEKKKEHVSNLLEKNQRKLERLDMRFQLRCCPKCNKYTLKEKCSACNESTKSASGKIFT